MPLLHPIIAAKQMATVDHVGGGRLGVNVVCGWNEDEFHMFGVDKHEHDDRYAQGEEWWTIIRRVWSGEPAFDFRGHFYDLEAVEGQPVPYAQQRPLMMNAGSSPRGRQFAVEHSDMHFDGVRSPEDSADRVADTKIRAGELGRSVQVWTPVGVICRSSSAEAREFLEYLVQHADRGAIGHLAEMHANDTRGRTDDEGLGYPGRSPLERQVLARGSYCAVGDADHVAAELLKLHAAGFDGLVLNFLDYLAELPYFAQEVLPRLERAGARAVGRGCR